MSRGAMHWTRGYLACPRCGAPSIESTGYGCPRCEEGSDTCGNHEPQPLWFDGDESECPACRAAVRITTDDDRAAAVEVAP